MVMKTSRPLRFAAALIALVSVLFAQLAVAGYACPGLKIDISLSMQGKMHDGMSGCAGMDQKQPNLCHAHDQVGNQSLDKPDLPLVQPFIAAAMVTNLSSIDIDPTGPYQISHESLTQATAPPHAILHCCYRI
jgi:hypothetical protein